MVTDTPKTGGIGMLGNVQMALLPKSLGSISFPRLFFVFVSNFAAERIVDTMQTITRAKHSRLASFLIVAAVYIIAAVVGIGIYRTLPFDWWLNLLLADVAATVVTFVFSVLFENASVYDPYWSVQPIVILAAFAVGTPLNPVRVLLLVAVCIWGARLTLNWAYTFHGLDHQDWRYTMLCEQTGGLYPLVNFFGIHMVPTLIVYLCTVPAAYAFLHDAAWNVGSVLFFCVSLGAVILQGSADFQMHRFRKQHTGGFIRDDLWKYSRHPNYLGEILMWWGVALAVVSVFPHMWYLCVGAACNTLLFLGISIPMADRRQSAKPGFAEYKQKTRMLLPIKK